MILIYIFLSARYSRTDCVR